MFTSRVFKKYVANPLYFNIASGFCQPREEIGLPEGILSGFAELNNSTSYLK
jgi:hypothetical protein